MDTSSYKELWGEVKKYLSLQIDYAKLTAVEKITILVSTMTFVGIVIVLSTCALFFLSEAVVNWLIIILNNECAANLIVFGVFVLLLIIVFLFKKSLIINPVARFVTKLLLNPPKK